GNSRSPVCNALGAELLRRKRRKSVPFAGRLPTKVTATGLFHSWAPWRQQALSVVQNCIGNCIRGGSSNAIENCLCTPERRRGGRGSFRGALVVNASR